MNADELRRLLKASAFRPFTVHLQDQAFRISHPEFAAQSPLGDTLVIFHENDGAFEILDVALIAHAEVHEPNPPR